nr:hypothetical protein GCM10020241_60250 [Streptoalloteichus tenebrarius]
MAVEDEQGDVPALLALLSLGRSPAVVEDPGVRGGGVGQADQVDEDPRVGWCGPGVGRGGPGVGRGGLTGDGDHVGTGQHVSRAHQYPGAQDHAVLVADADPPRPVRPGAVGRAPVLGPHVA